MAKKIPFSQWKNLARVLVKDDLMLKAADGMKAGLARVPRREPVLISIQKPWKEDSASPAKALKMEMEEKMAARAPVTVPADEFVSKVTSGLHRMGVSMVEEAGLEKKLDRTKRLGDKLVESASQKGIDLAMASWNQGLIDIMHKLEDMDAEDGSASDSKKEQDLEKIWRMIWEHIEAHMNVVLEKLR